MDTAGANAATVGVVVSGRPRGTVSALGRPPARRPRARRRCRNRQIAVDVHVSRHGRGTAGTARPQEEISDTPLEQQTKRILRWFRAKARPVTMNEFTRANQGLMKKTRTEILETLAHSGQLVVEKKGKRTTISFRELV